MATSTEEKPELNETDGDRFAKTVLTAVVSGLGTLLVTKGYNALVIARREAKKTSEPSEN
jgi:hypothetical protein